MQFKNILNSNLLRSNLFIYSLFFTILIVLKYKYIILPCFWDELSGPPYQVYTDYISTFFQVLKNTNYLYNHPPVSAFILGTICKITTYSVLTLKITTCAFSALSLFFVYKIGQKLISDLFGMMLAILVLIDPLFWIHSVAIRHDVFLLCFALGSIYFAFNKKPGLTALFLFLAIFTKLPGIAVAFSIFIFFLLQKSPGKQKLKALALTLIPVLVLIISLIQTKLNTGNLINHPAILDFSSTRLHNIDELTDYLKFLVWNRGQLILTIPFLLALFIHLVYRKWSGLFRLDIFALIIVWTSFSIVFLFQTYAPQFYFLIPTTFFIIITMFYTWNSSRYKSLLIILIILRAILGFNYLNEDVPTGENSPRYADIIKVYSEAISYLEKHHHSDKISAEWPMDRMLTQISDGYSSKPFPNILNFFEQYSIVYHHAKNRITPEEITKDKYDILVVADIQDGAKLMKQLRLVKLHNLKIIKQWGPVGKRVTVYSH